MTIVRFLREYLMFEQARYPLYCSDTSHCHIGCEGLCTKAKGCKAQAAGLEKNAKIMGISDT
jgi:hypothetical protein